jgi:hypothetical protein
LYERKRLKPRKTSKERKKKPFPYQLSNKEEGLREKIEIERDRKTDKGLKGRGGDH